MSSAYLGIGTNLGDKENNIRQAVALIEEQIGKATAVSSFYESEPWGFVSDHRFINIALIVETSLSPEQLLEKTQEIERELGRKNKTTNGYTDRIIDIDILLYDDLIADCEKLKIPHPLLQERDFAVIPLTEIAPDYRHPILGVSIKELSVKFQ